jgi:hypothetical protein
MPEYRCSQVVNTFVDDGVNTQIPCGKIARRKMMIPPGYDAGFWLDGCCEDCVAGLRKDVGLTEEEIDTLYPVWGEALPYYNAALATAPNPPASHSG